jgi:hypothetical protein
VEVLRGIVADTDLVTGRQFGKSTSFGWDGTWYGTTHSNREVYCFGPTLDQAKIVWNEIARHFREPSPLSVLVEGKIVEFPFPLIKLVNGTRIHARGANSAKYIRGHVCHRGYADEAAFFKEGILGDVIEPMFLVAGRQADSALIKTSTPFGQGEFYESYHRPSDEDHRSFHFTSYDNPYADRKRLERAKARYGEDSLRWRTEYLGEWPDAEMAVFPWQDIKAAYEAYPYDQFPVAPDPQHRYLQGVDLANRSDYFVASVADCTNPSLVVKVRQDRFQKRGYTFYKGLIRSNYGSYNHARTLLDATTLAESVVEDLADINAEGYAFTGSQAKYEVVQELARLMSEHRWAMPFDRDMVDEYRYFEYEVTPSKRVKMEARKGHDDIVMADALVAHLALIPRMLGFFQPVSLHQKPLYVPAKPGYDPIAELFAFED